MKKLRVLLVTLVCALTFGSGVQAAEPETEMGKQMDKMSGAFRALRRQAADATKNADSLAKLKTIRDMAVASEKLEPAMKAEIPADKQAKFVADYRAKMKEFIALVDKAEAAFKANNNEEAAKILGSMADAQKAGHKDFKKKDKK